MKVTKSSVNPSAIRRVIIRGANWVGDAAMTIPALRELRLLLPQAHLTLATRPGTAGLFVDADHVDELMISEDRGWGGLRTETRNWRNGKFDLAVLFPNSFQTALVPALARVPLRVGYETQGRRFLLTHPVPLPEWRSSRHEVYYYLNLVAAAEKLIKGTSTIATCEPDFAIAVSNERRQVARETLLTLGVDGQRPLVAICPGSVNSRAKRWPAERFAALGDRLIEELGAEVLLIGSAEERDVSIDVAQRMRHQPAIATGTSDLAQATAILSTVDLLLTNDTGPAHIASALGRPTLVIFGPTNPLTTHPFSSTGEIIRHPPVCAPCMLRDCPIDHRCMTAISVNDVFDRAQTLLGSSVSLMCDKL